MVGAEEWEKGPGARRPEGRSCSFHFHNTGRLIMFSAPTAVQAGAQRQAAQGGGGRGGLMYCASQFPKVEIDKIKVTLEAGNLFSVDVTVKNDRVYPTFSDRENELGTAVQDKLMFRSAGK